MLYEAASEGDPTSMTTRLSQLTIGSRAVIARVEGERPVRRRLMELGLVPGTSVALVNIAPLGDPLELEVRGCRLSIRQREASAITLEHVERPAEQRRRLRVFA
jgi:ferrous iron transport protein A